MKRTLLVLVLLLVAFSAFALEGAVTWMWYSNDPHVQFYRYQLDGEDPDLWVIVDSSIEEVTINVDLSVEHVLYLQQSYNGRNWSDSSIAYSEVFVEEEEPEEIIEEEPEEEVVPQQEAEAEAVPEEVVEEVPAAPDFSFKPYFILDVGASYADSIPHENGPRTLGASVALTYLWFDLDVAQAGPKVVVGAFSTKDIVYDRDNIRVDMILDTMACLSIRVAGSDVFMSFGPEIDVQVGAQPCVRLGAAFELGCRYHRSDNFSVGLAVCDHYSILPRNRMTNNFELRLFGSVDID